MDASENFSTSINFENFHGSFDSLISFVHSFQTKSLVEIIGLQNSQRHIILLNLILNKVVSEFIVNKQKKFVLYVDTELIFSATRLKKLIDKLIFNLSTSGTYNREICEEIRQHLENCFYLYKIQVPNKFFEFYNSELHPLVTANKISYIVFDTIHSLLNFEYKNKQLSKKYIFDLLVLAQNKQLLIIFMNNLKYTKTSQDFFLVPENQETLGEYMSSIYLFEAVEGKSNQVVVHPMKSNWVEQDFLLDFEDDLINFK